jgi:hypothetical protein
MKIGVSEACNTCPNQSEVLDYAAGCRTVERQVQDTDEFILVNEGAVVCGGFKRDMPGQSRDRMICRAEMTPPLIVPANPVAIFSPEGVEAAMSVRVSPPPEIERRVTVHPVQ